MRTITICVGSACHMKGSHHVIDRLQELIAELERQREEARIEAEKERLRQERENRLNTVIDDKDIFDLTRDNVDEVFDREILNAQ